MPLIQSRIRATLRRRRFEFAARDYAHFTAKKGRLYVTVYEKGPKMLVQGNEAGELARSVLEPLMAGGVEEEPILQSSMQDKQQKRESEAKES